MRKLLSSVTFLAAFLLIGSPAQSNVSLRNGNFFVAYTDIIYPGGAEPKVERVCNSKSPYKGMYGWCWGTEYEVFLTVAADGCVVVHEYGGGAENRFCPPAFNAKELDQAVGMIASAAQKAGAYGSAEALEGYKKQLRSSAEFRSIEWEKLRSQGRLQSRSLKEGTQLVSNKFSFQKITREKSGYTRAFDNGKVEKFSDAGKLVRVLDKNNNFVDLGYGKDGRLAKLTDNFNRKIFFNFNNRGLLESIDGENKKRAEYRYNGKDELVYSKDVDGNVYQYKYDVGGRHNMIEIAYSDKTTQQISYYGKDKFENVKTVKDRDGSVTEYSYGTDPSDRGHLSVSVNVKGKDNKEISKSSYEYFFKRKADGEEWTYKMITSIDGDRTETTYNECCGLPLLIKRGTEETSFEYDTKGRVTKKITPTDITILAYDPNVGKVTRVERHSKLDKKRSNWSEFKYDQRGNLFFAKNSDGKGVKLIYDGNGRIRTMVDQNQRQITFKYNENSKPIEITDPKLGTITVTYANSGEIKKVDSTAGRKIALQVTSAFQNLLDIIRPAGVSLSF